ncbi:hypothetical protein [Streptomyces virginiae]|uniref:hypothetical protein n=1 Tax=Streptomyces virginiae TaxID=1961 RepID=UPI00363EAEDF
MIVTIAASIAGLVTTGVATLFSALVAGDQLDQSRQAAEEKRQAQAARVSYWVDIQQDGTPRLHLMNRSPDPISNIQMTFTLYRDIGGTPDRPDFDPDMHIVSFAVYMPGVPPCSDMVLTPNNMRYRDDRSDKEGDKSDKAIEWYYWKGKRNRWNDPFDDLPIKGGWLDFGKADHRILVDAADFNDRDGVRWRRTGGLLTRNPPRPPDPNALMWGVVQAVPPQPLKTCGN